MTPRYALYFAPRAGSAWARFGAAALLGEARRYGFHATLKAPFRLAPGARCEDLAAALDAWAASHARFTLPPLARARLDDFIALVPAAGDARLDAIADECVSRFEPFRAPLSAEELARRLRRPLSPRQRELLGRWGYPYVFDEFRFHLSLTGPLAAGRKPRFPAAPAAPLAFDGVCLYEEPAPGARFRCLHRAPFRGAGRLLYVAGPSGAGKDSVLGWAKRHLRTDAPVLFARRSITRAPDPEGEDHECVTEEEFERRRAGGEFALAWSANGLHYGIGAGIRDALAKGLTVVVSGSREYLPEALREFPEMEVVLVTAPAAQIHGRLHARRRETPEMIARRLERAERFAPPAQLVAARLVNDGDLASAGREFLALLDA